jgi:peptide/nickel transport system permease protein
MLAALTVWFAVSCAFFLARVLPADPALLAAGPHAPAAVVESARTELGLDQPLGQQYVHYVGGALRLDLGTSTVLHRPVVALLAERIGPTTLLALTALVIELLVGLAAGILAATRGEGPVDRAIDGAVGVASALGLAGPTLVWGTVLLFLFGFRLGWFPLAGTGDGTAGDTLAHLALPAIALAIPGIAQVARVTRSEVREALARDHVRAARARGLSATRVLFGHAVRNALPPVVALAGVDLGVLLGGAVVVESIFNWPGVGQLAMRAVLALDLPLLLGTVLLAAVAVTASSLVADLVNLWLDPRPE